MKLNELMIRDIRAEIEFENNIITIKNAKGEVKKELLSFFKQQIEKKSSGKEIANEIEILELLINKLTNIEIDSEDIRFIINNPSHELARVMLYLSSIMQELIFESMSTINLEMRMQENTLLEKDTLNTIANLENIIKEIKHRKLLKENGEDIQ